MKKQHLFLIPLLLLVGLLSCNKDESVAQILEVRDAVSFTNRTNVRTITVNTNVSDWSADVVSPGGGWCRVNPDKSSMIHFLEIEVDANEEFESRETEVVILAGGLSKRVKVTQLGEKEEIILNVGNVKLDSEKTTLEIEVTANVEYEVLPRASWIKRVGKPQTKAFVENVIYFEISEFLGVNSRTGFVEFNQKNEGPITETLTVEQTGFEVNLDEDEFLKDDVKLIPSRSWASDAQANQGIERTYDGSLSTNWHSNYGPVRDITMQYWFDGAESLDKIIIWGRQDASNTGNIKEFDVYASTDGENEFHVGSFDFSNSIVKPINTIHFNVENPKYIKFVVHSSVLRAGDNLMSVICSEMEFYQVSKDKDKATELFIDSACSALKEGVTLEDIEAVESPLVRSMAMQMYNGVYEYGYRVEQYKPVKTKKLVADELKVKDAFSRYENITGIYLPEGKTVVFVGDMYNKKVNLFLPNAMRQPDPGYPADKDPAGWGLKNLSVPLKEGINIIEVPYDCNAYIDYTADNPAGEPAITVHFPMGHVNGYFDASKHTNADWNRLLDNAPGRIMDAKGKYVQTMYPVNYLRKFAYGQGVELLATYDKLLKSHYTFMGMDKHGRMPEENRLLGRVNFNYFMFQDGDGTAYIGNDGTMETVLSPARIEQECWGLTHEFGHVLQMSNLTTWGGMGEVSNNWLAMYTTVETFGQQSRLSKSGTYDKARNSIVLSNPKISYLQDNDVFNRLVPFWQLHLYFSRNGYPDFYPDLFEELRQRQPAGTGSKSIDNHFEFAKIACDVSKTDLTDFFDAWGFFYVGKIEVGDYGDYVFDVTQKQVDEVKDYIASKGYAKPDMDVTTIKD